VQADVEGYRCRHGLGYTVIGSSRGGIEVETLYFVASARRSRCGGCVTNRRAGPASLSLFSAVEFCFVGRWDDQTNFQRNLNTGEVEVDGSTIFHVTEYRERRDHFAWLRAPRRSPASTRRASSWAVSGMGTTGRGRDRSCDRLGAHGWAPMGHITWR
jgi:cellobiose phosphorylase